MSSDGTIKLAYIIPLVCALLVPTISFIFTFGAIERSQEYLAKTIEDLNVSIKVLSKEANILTTGLAVANQQVDENKENIKRLTNEQDSLARDVERIKAEAR